MSIERVSCPFNPDYECTCPNRPQAESFEMRRGLGALSSLGNILANILKQNRELQDQDLDAYKDETTSEKARRIRAQEALNFFVQNGANPHLCPYFTEDINLPGKG